MLWILQFIQVYLWTEFNTLIAQSGLTHFFSFVDNNQLCAYLTPCKSFCLYSKNGRNNLKS